MPLIKLSYINIRLLFIGPDKEAETYAPTPIIRAKHWVSVNYEDKVCYGPIVRGICVFGLQDLVWLVKLNVIYLI